MRHRALKVVRTAVVFLLLGAIINVAVAWGLTAWHGTPRLQQVAYQRTLTGTTRLRAWTIWRGEDVGRLRVKSSWHEGPAPKGSWGGLAQSGNPTSAVLRWSGLLRPAEEDRTGTPYFHCRIVDCAGWPMLSMWCCVKARQAGRFPMPIRSPTTVADRHVTGGVELPPAIGRTTRAEPWRALPMYPLWLGFAINSVVYGGSLWLTVALLTALRRLRRGQRGLCEQCGYDLRGAAHDRCSECGAMPRAGPVSGATT